MIDATQSLLQLAATDEEREYLQGIVSLYRPLLRELLAAVPEHIAGQVLAAGEKALGPLYDVGNN